MCVWERESEGEWVTDLIHHPTLHFQYQLLPFETWVQLDKKAKLLSFLSVSIRVRVLFPFWSSSHLAVAHVCPVNRSSLSVPLKRPLSLYYFSSLPVFLSSPLVSFMLWWPLCLHSSRIPAPSRWTSERTWLRQKLKAAPQTCSYTSDQYSPFFTGVVSWKRTFLKLSK